MTDQDKATLEHALMALESAAWSRSWTRLQSARRQVHGITSIRLVGMIHTCKICGPECSC